jgi:hypothetical protein
MTVFQHPARRLVSAVDVSKLSPMVINMRRKNGCRSPMHGRYKKRIEQILKRDRRRSTLNSRISALGNDRDPDNHASASAGVRLRALRKRQRRATDALGVQDPAIASKGKVVPKLGTNATGVAKSGVVKRLRPSRLQ